MGRGREGGTNFVSNHANYYVSLSIIKSDRLIIILTYDTRCLFAASAILSVSFSFLLTTHRRKWGGTLAWKSTVTTFPCAISQKSSPRDSSLGGELVVVLYVLHTLVLMANKNLTGSPVILIRLNPVCYHDLCQSVCRDHGT